MISISIDIILDEQMPKLVSGDLRVWTLSGLLGGVSGD